MTEYVEIKGKTQERARQLLELADELGIDSREVKTTIGGFRVPAEMVDEEGELLPGKSEDDGQYDPADHNADAVVIHLATLGEDPEETERILAAEREGKGRKGILGTTNEEQA